MSKKPSGFSVIELLLVVGILAIFAGIILIVLHPTDNSQLIEARNRQRQSDVNTIYNALLDYRIDNSGSLPPCIESSPKAICGSQGCGGVENGCDLTPLLGNYLVSIPLDPSGAKANNTGYAISKDGDALTVSAPSAENGEMIEVKSE